MKTCCSCKQQKNPSEFYNSGKYPRCRTCDYNFQKKYISNDPLKYSERRRNQYLKLTYNLTEEAYNLLLEKQNGVCRICKERVCRLAVDHNHETGEVRGLLCNSCNRAIGMLKDDPAILRDAADYLEQTH